MLTEANIHELAKAGESEALEFKRTTGLRREAAQTSHSTANSLQFALQLGPFPVPIRSISWVQSGPFPRRGGSLTWEW